MGADVTETLKKLAALRDRYKKAGKFAEAKAVQRAMEVLKCQ